MAKEQNLSLNPTKISGICGRLMCCLKYEEDVYEVIKQDIPPIGTRVSTPSGDGIVVDTNILKRVVKVKLIDGEETDIKEYKLDDVRPV
jgi:cell fate regulator YaaT (PSP1 superfamily)